MAEPELTRCFPRGRSSADPDRATRLPFAFDSGHARTMRTSCASRDSDPRDNTDLALVNSGYSKTKLRRGCSGVSLSEFFPHQTDIPVPIGDSRRPNGTASTPHHGISRRHRIGKYRQTENIRQFFVTALHTAEIFLANLPSHPDPKTGPLIQTSRLSPVLRLFYLFDISFIRRRFAIPEVAPLRRCCC